MNILIVDDNIDDCEFIERSLKKADVEDLNVSYSHNLKSTFRLIEQEKYDCLLLDYHLPDGNGLEIVREIRYADEFVPVVMITGQGDEELASKAILDGAQDYIVKEKIHPDTLILSIYMAKDKMMLSKRIKEHGEERTRLIKELEDSNAKLTSFCHTVAHDIKSPIGLMINLLSLMEVVKEEEQIDELRKRSLDNAKKLMTFVEDVLKFAINNQQKVNKVKVDLNETLKEVREHLDIQIKSKKAKVDIGEMPSVKGDKTMLYQIFQNLIGNALKFTKDGEVPVISVQKTSLNYELLKGIDGKYFQVEIRDNGIGMNDEDLNEIFEPFKRLNSTDEYKGSGIGLATVKNMIDKLDGVINVKSEVGVGTTFQLIFPIS